MKSPAHVPSRAALRLIAVLLAGVSGSCIAPPPQRAYRPEVARQLDHLAHDAPVTPLPGPGAWVWESY